MKTRVRPYEYDSYSPKWAVEIFDPHGKRVSIDKREGEWVTHSKHRFFWKANWKAYRLAQYSLAVKENKKDKFVRRLKDGDEIE